MAVGAGIVGWSSAGYSGSLVVNLKRMVDSDPLRDAVADHQEADLVVLVSDQVFAQIVRPGYAGLTTAQFQPVQVAVKEFKEQAWLWVPLPPGQSRSVGLG